MPDCFSCRQNETDPATLPPRELVYDDGGWRVAHAFNSALPGWLVVVARRHITSLAELTADEAAALGPLLRALSLALEEHTGAQKAYVLFLAESPGFQHVHVHVVPRLPDLPEERRAVRVVGYLDEADGPVLLPEEMDRIALALRPLVRRHLQPA